ncbi:12-oxophytodienoate reductase [Micromonospora aurantiaca (nom. illeg.)]|uniref:oxidoreductase n=1 Tax=Micromonospora aurantiaca (nom. illeg.) TaxID=47850 RepID=UPI0001BF4F21|nr:12-oxophytodienoate reductase [Micromonospora aurantiaca]ADL47211.1 NADH:flavin oxidoreductase/NADH oxidase [Micromonospora aurantiaca ATCC 27029]
MNATLDTGSPVTPLLEPVTVAGLPLPSRFVMAPMTRNRAPGGVPTPEMADYYRRRAAAGIGLIVTEGVLVDHPSAGHEDTVPRMTAGAAEAGWRGVVEAVHAAGGRIAAQLWHLGSLREPVDGRPAWTPSGVREPGRPAPYAMTAADVDTLLAAYANAAGVAVRAGFDAIEIHAAHGYLLDEFLWPYTNRRTDAFGGSPERRAAFPAAVVRAVRAQVPARHPVIVRFSQFKERAFDARIAETPAELAQILGAFAEAGADVLHASQRRFWQPAFPGSPLNLAGWAKRLTGLPSITVGSVGLRRDFLRPDGPESVAGLAARLADGEFDLVALGRALLGNPAWVTHAAAGRLGEIVDYRKAHEDVYP